MVRGKIFVDTNVLIDHLRQKPQVETYWDKLLASDDFLVVSGTVIQELFVGRSSLRQKKVILELVEKVDVVEFGWEEGRLAGEWIRDEVFGFGDFADAQVAAVAVVNGCKLATLNRKGFESVPGLELWEWV